MEATLTSSLGRTTLGPGTLNIGRASDNQLVIDNPQVSSHHAEIKLSEDGTAYVVTDLDSRNGTFINEKALPAYTPHVLNTNDIIRIGSVRFTYKVASTAYDNEPTVAASSLSYEPTVAATPEAFSSYTADVPEAQSVQESSADADSANPPALPDYPLISPAPPPVSSPPGFGREFRIPEWLKGRIGLLIVLALASIAIIAVIVLGGNFSNHPEPTATLQTFCNDLKNNDAQGLYDLLSSRAQAKTSVDKLKAFLGLIQLTGGIRDCTVSSVQDNGSTATGRVIITLKNSKSGQPTQVQLVNEGGTWKMDDSLDQSPGG